MKNLTHPRGQSDPRLATNSTEDPADAVRDRERRELARDLAILVRRKLRKDASAPPAVATIPATADDGNANHRKSTPGETTCAKPGAGGNGRPARGKGDRR